MIGCRWSLDRLAWHGETRHPSQRRKAQPLCHYLVLPSPYSDAHSLLPSPVHLLSTPCRRLRLHTDWRPITFPSRRGIGAVRRRRWKAVAKVPRRADEDILHQRPATASRPWTEGASRTAPFLTSFHNNSSSSRTITISPPIRARALPAGTQPRTVYAISDTTPTWGARTRPWQDPLRASIRTTWQSEGCDYVHARKAAFPPQRPLRRMESDGGATRGQGTRPMLPCMIILRGPQRT